MDQGRHGILGLLEHTDDDGDGLAVMQAEGYGPGAALLDAGCDAAALLRDVLVVFPLRIWVSRMEGIAADAAAI